VHTPIDPTRLLGRHSRLLTAEGVIDGKILAVGAKGFAIATDDHQVRRLTPAQVLGMNLDFSRSDN
jgi:hypothetical protein